MLDIKYIYTEKGQQEAVIVPIEFWNDIFKKFDLKKHLTKENYFISKYTNLLTNLSIKEVKETEKTNEDAFYALAGSWQSDKTGDEINEEIYSSRMNKTENIQF